MAKNQESINRSLFELLRTKGYHPIMLDTSGKEIPIPEEAEVFQFKFSKEGKEYGTVTVTIDGLHKLVIYFGEDVANSEKEESDSSDTSWYSLLRQLKRFALSHQLSFEIKNVDNLKYDMAKRDHMKKQEQISEGYYPMGKKASYSDNIPQAKIIIQHTRQIEEGEQRYRNVDKIFVENVNGERFLLPTNKPGLARVYARHIAEGGTPYDERGKHITGLVEEYQKMAGFVRATRGSQFNESATKLVEQGINHYQSLRETLHKMTGRKGYVSYFESYTPPLMEDDSDDSTLNELFVQETLDPRIESVMPILKRLSKNISEMKEVSELAEWADSLIEGEEEDVKEATDLKSIPDESIEESGLQAYLGNKKYGKDGMDALRKAGREHASKEKMASIRAKYDKLDEEDTDEGLLQLEDEGEIDEGMLDKLKSVGQKVLSKLGHPSDDELIKDFQRRAGIPPHGQHGKLPMAAPNPKKDEIEEDLGPEQKRVGQLGPTEKVKNNNIGKLVGANESIELSEMDKSEDKKGPEGKATPIKADKAKKDFGKILQKSVDKHNKAKQDTDEKVKKYMKEGALDDVRARMQSGSALDRLRSGQMTSPRPAPAAQPQKPAAQPSSSVDRLRAAGRPPAQYPTSAPTQRPQATATQSRPQSTAQVPGKSPYWNPGQATNVGGSTAADQYSDRLAQLTNLVKRLHARDGNTEGVAYIQQQIRNAIDGKPFDNMGLWDDGERVGLHRIPDTVKEGQQDLEAILRIVRK